MNNYISRYNAGDTQFKRTDPFKGASFDEPASDKWLAGVALVVFFLLVAFYVG